MQNINESKVFLSLAILTAAVLVSGLVITPSLIDQSADAQPGKAKKEKVKAQKPAKEKDKDEKVKPEKGKEKKVAKEKKKVKAAKQTRFEVIVDGSQVSNVTDALLNYDFTVTANGLVSKAKQLEVGNDTDDISNMQITFNAKSLSVTTNDTFSASATSLALPYLSDTVSGTFAEQEQGKSGKMQAVGTVDEPLVLVEAGEEVEEQIPDDFE